MVNVNSTMDVRRWLVTVALTSWRSLRPVARCSPGHHTDTIASYTGCLTKGGAVTEVAVGEVPLRPCGPDHTEVHVPGGDITAVAAGDGLTGGASTGMEPPPHRAPLRPGGPRRRHVAVQTKAQLQNWDRDFNGRWTTKT